MNVCMYNASMYVFVSGSLRPKRVFAFLGHAHYHIMTRVMVWSNNKRNNIKLVVASHMRTYINMLFFILYIYNTILQRSFYIYGCSRSPSKSTLSFTAKSVYVILYFSIFHRNENSNFLIFIALCLL